MSTDQISFDILVLGAGAPHNGETPPALRETSLGRLVLDWLAKAYSIGLPLRVLEKQDWQNADSLHSRPLAM